jgi:formylglycine-generating enzyme required for sulfatase activity
MRGAVVGAAVLMAAAIAGMGALAWSALSGPSTKAREGARVSRADERPPGKPDRPDKPRGARGAPSIDEPAAAPAAPRIAADDQGDPRDPEVANGAASPAGVSARPGGPGVAPAGGLGDPGVPVGPGARPAAASLGAATGTLGQPLPPAALVAVGSACPMGMVDVGAFCIDATEVTNVAYGAFLDAKPNSHLQPATCSWNVDYMPSGGPPASDTRPVVGVDWCDAWLYCASSGKRMCGHVGSGGNNPAGAFANASMSEWYSVCTNGGVSAFSYGDTFDGTKCAHAGDDGTLAHVSAIASCVGTTPPYDAVFDMSGNAWEWEDSCAGDRGGGDLCRVRGGGQHSSSAEVSCAMDYLAKREQTFKTVGFRCCAGRKPGF